MSITRKSSRGSTEKFVTMTSVSSAPQTAGNSGVGRGKSGRQTALEGINLLFNNHNKEAEELFFNQKDKCVQMRMGYCFVAFMNALMTFEEEKINQAIQILKETENKFAHDISSFQSMKKIVLGSSNTAEANLEERLEKQISVADCQVCMAILIFTNQDLTNYVKGGWILRKAWKIYERTYREIRDLYEKYFGVQTILPLTTALVRLDNQSTDDLTNPQNWMSSSEEALSLAERPTASARPNVISARASMTGTSLRNLGNLPAETVARLLASVSFGYGTFQLCISLLPPNMLRLIHFLGFEGDRDVGIEAMMYARQGLDIRSPFATLGLLWYHTIVRPFFSLDGRNISAGVEAAEFLLEESKSNYGSAPLFLFYKGRIERLKGHLDAAILAYDTALKASTQREIQLICLHEMGWCYILQFKWKEGNRAFVRLKEESRWAKSFYGYLVALTLGILDKTIESQRALADVPALVRKKSNQLESFVLKRSHRLLKEPITRQIMMVYGMELLYLWHAFPSCSVEILDEMLSECDHISAKKLLPLKCLLEGAIHNYKNNSELAVQCLEESIARSTDNKEEMHIPAYATYELSMILLQTPETHERGKLLLCHAKDGFKNYDFENRLNVRIHAAMKNLDRKPCI